MASCSSSASRSPSRASRSESRRFSPLYGSRRSSPLFVLKRVGLKRGRLVRSEFSSSKRLPFTGWSQSGGDISQLVLPDIAASVDTSAHNCSTLSGLFAIRWGSRETTNCCGCLYYVRGNGPRVLPLVRPGRCDFGRGHAARCQLDPKLLVASRLTVISSPARSPDC
jgi:hypothetical protein